jgi:hypothetical protein
VEQVPVLLNNSSSSKNNARAVKLIKKEKNQVPAIEEKKAIVPRYKKEDLPATPPVAVVKKYFHLGLCLVA